MIKRYMRRWSPSIATTVHFTVAAKVPNIQPEKMAKDMALGRHHHSFDIEVPAKQSRSRVPRIC